MDYCSMCAASTTKSCASCGRFEHFAPSGAYKQYFQKDEACNWTPGGENLKPTAAVQIGSFYICAYCGEYSFSLACEDGTAHCCLCKGALAELEYKKRVRLLKSLHCRQLAMLEQQFCGDMVFHTGTLKAIKRGAAIGAEADNPGYDSYFDQTPEFKKLFHLII